MKTSLASADCGRTQNMLHLLRKASKGAEACPDPTPDLTIVQEHPYPLKIVLYALRRGDRMTTDACRLFKSLVNNALKHGDRVTTDACRLSNFPVSPAWANPVVRMALPCVSPRPTSKRMRFLKKLR
ncbi:hypothetical protein LTR66_001090 [Elasticomyces elasticus]|nr:hypothetical protein LTR50_003899 [Elasticomyces elasticus]KAK4999958.1 hypothetical protein LTR66_001090 [Elasticomyces elasticus]